VNVSGTDKANDKRKMALTTTIFSTFDEVQLVNFGPLTKRMAFTFDLDIQQVCQSTCSVFFCSRKIWSS